MTKLLPLAHPLRLATTGTALGLLLNFASPSLANEPLQFGQPLPGRPEPAPPAADPDPPAPRTPASISTPQNDTTEQIERPPSRLPTRQRTRRRDRASSPRRLPQARPQASTARPSVLPPSPSTTAVSSDGGWDVPAGTAGVIRSPETLPSQTRSTVTVTPVPPVPAAQRLSQPNGYPRTAQRYTVYVLGDRLSLLDQISQITPSAAFTTYNQQTAVSAGSFNRPIDAEARVKELSQIGLKGIIAPVPSSAVQPGPAIAPQPVLGDPNANPVDPRNIFNNFDSSIPPNALQANLPSQRLPIPNHGTSPPISRKSRNRRLPQPPPNLQQQLAFSNHTPTPYRPAISPLFRHTTPQPNPPSIQRTSTPNSGGYYLSLSTNSVSRPQQLTQQLLALGLADRQISQAQSGKVAIGPFRDLSEANQWNKQLHRNGLQNHITQNGWIIETP